MASEKEKDRLRERIGACLAVRDFDAAMDAVRELAKDEATRAEALGAAASIHIEAGDFAGAAPLFSLKESCSRRMRRSPRSCSARKDSHLSTSRRSATFSGR